MYINDVHILAYLFIALLGGAVGFFSGWCNERLPENKKIFTKEILLEYKYNVVKFVKLLSSDISPISFVFAFKVFSVVKLDNPFKMPLK